MVTRSAEAVWEGDLKSGHGRLQVGSRSFDAPYSFSTRFEAGKDGTNPEELIGAAHAGCFSMALAKALGDAGHSPKAIKTEAKVHLETTPGGGFTIPRIELAVTGDADGIDEAKFNRIAEDAKKNCPVSKLLSGAEVTLRARLSRG